MNAVVHFYAVYNCQLTVVNNVPALIAPQGVDLNALSFYRFVQLQDGNWYHFLTQDEYNYIQAYSSTGTVVFSQTPQNNIEDDVKGNKVAGFSLGFWVLQYALLGVYAVIAMISDTDSSGMIYGLVSILSGASSLASFVLMLIARIKYPKNKLGKVVMWVFIINFIITILAIILFIGVFIQCIGSWTGQGV